MDELFITLDPILDVNIMKMADWCASTPQSFQDAPVDVSTRWELHVNEMKLDPANLFFVLMIDQDKDGKLKSPLDGTGVTREAFGRIPGEKSPIDYLCEFLIPNNGNERLKILLDALANRFEGHACLRGTGGIIIRGAISMQETKELRDRLISRNWRINQNETIDGAVSEIIRLLLLLLRRADSRACGVMLREHR